MEKQFPKPNEHGVYPKEQAEAIRFVMPRGISKSYYALAHVLELDTGFISSYDVSHPEGGRACPLSANTSTVCLTRQGAVDGAVTEIVKSLTRDKSNIGHKLFEAVLAQADEMGIKIDPDAKDDEPEAPKDRRYKLADGRVLWVGPGLGGMWIVCDSDPEAPGKHKFTSPSLPAMATREECQENLDEYAEEKGLEAVEGPQDELPPPVVLRETKKELPVKFTSLEKTRFSTELVLKIQERSRLDDQKKNSASMYSAKLKAVDAEIDLLATRLSTGEENKTVVCHWQMNFPVIGRKTLFRKDTMEIVEEDEMLPSDRQLVLDDVANMNGKTERGLDEKEVGEITEDSQPDEDDEQEPDDDL